MLKAKPNNFAILKEYIDTTLSFVLFVVFDSFLKELIHFFAVDVYVLTSHSPRKFQHWAFMASLK